jgi:serine phosphatase RsbU (regulator of sigma subunit)
MTETFLQKMNIYIVPPLLSLLLGWSLAIVSLVRGKFKTENILFALVCIWWTLMSPIFISHHLLKGDIATIMKIERSIHFVYVYLPFVTLLYFEKAFSFKNRPLLIVTLVVSVVTSAFTFTDYYFSGLHEFSWGYIGRGGIAFKAWGAYGFFITGYILFTFANRFRKSTNQTEKLKIKYIILSFIATAMLTAMNVPAISGIDFYPFGNFMFIPLSLLAFGVFRYRLMDVRSVLYITLIWVITSSLIIIPNALLFFHVRPYLGEMNSLALFFILLIWFAANLFYFMKIQPVIDRFFNRYKYNLNKAGLRFIDTVSHLRTMDDLSLECTDLLRRTLNIKSVSLYVRDEDRRFFVNRDKSSFRMPDGIETWMAVMDHIVERDMVLSNPSYNSVRDGLATIFDYFKCQYIVPLVQNNELIGVLFLSERHDLRQLSPTEIRFLNMIRSSVSISISNSTMYQDLADLKDTLETKVEKRTEELLRAMETVESVNLELTSANSELENARLIADLDITMAAQVQKSIYPESIPDSDEWDIALEFRPMSAVSGDLYDFYMEGDRLRGISVLDVSGHGIASGLITMIARSVMYRNFFRLRAAPLNTVIAEANGEMTEEIRGSGKYLTGILLRFTDDIVEYVNAGHPDLIVKKSSSGRTHMVRPKNEDFKGIFLGVEGMELSCKSVKFRVDAGDTLLLFTDCLIEGKNDRGVPYGMDRLKETLLSVPPGTAHAVLNGILEDFLQFIGEKKLTDDLTIIIAKRR